MVCIASTCHACCPNLVTFVPHDGTLFVPISVAPIVRLIPHRVPHSITL